MVKVWTRSENSSNKNAQYPGQLCGNNGNNCSVPTLRNLKTTKPLTKRPKKVVVPSEKQIAEIALCPMTIKMPYGEESLPGLEACFPLCVFVLLCVNMCHAYKSTFLCGVL